MSRLRTYRRIKESKREILTKKRAKEIFAGSNFIALVDKEVPQIVYGFVAYRIHGKKLVVNFTYTKPEFRNNGFSRYLLSILENGKSEFVYSALTSKPRGYTLFEKYKMETLK